MNTKVRLLFGGIGCFSALLAAVAAITLCAMPWIGRSLYSRSVPSLLYDPAELNSTPNLTADNSTTGRSSGSAEIRRRLRAAGGQSGEVQITLVWFNRNDIDLHVVDPEGYRISYAQRRSPSGGELDVDRNVSAPLTTTPVENVVWPTGHAPFGSYSVFVHHYASNGDRDPTEYVVEEKVRGRIHRFQGAVSSGMPPVLVNKFTFDDPGAARDRDPNGHMGVIAGLISHPQIGEITRSWLTQSVTAALWFGLIGSLLGSILFAGVQSVLECPYDFHSAWQRARIGAFSGSLAGFAGQAVFFAVSFLPVPMGNSLCRTIGFIFLGGILGRLLSRAVPYLQQDRAVVYGIGGGLVAGLSMGSVGANDLGRLFATGTIGFGIGLAILILLTAMPEIVASEVIDIEDAVGIRPSRLRPNRGDGPTTHR